ncbi:aminoglycoside phosphotransferase [Beutenbergia cavernae DSM 12333]|uniref:Aminoglycoside phosphotransferase n=1 Tax=Beutenbergia cavernae (strain ATCC BAA-8 / DSM 12333 / CCUG 43141 / JCM 11478 / NBRC 16432 / NCIMB 13614 / HKI 0122) TaxID=471853 RepID=C5C4K5_BEUC1|nr:phosphotransferase [Beutenbergia cavernae]ACQ82129.1 aminoglycoside phosphotransferase [Beutenbergia cavernae DSM 12333]
MDLSHLGAPIGPRTRIHGGAANRMYRLDTDQGSFAVKELNVVDRRWPYRARDVFRLEQAAFAAGIPMPEPIAADDSTLVHRWVEGEKVPEEPVSVPYAFEIGELLARLHALDVDWADEPPEEPTPRDWPELAERAAATGQPWAGELASQVETFLAIAQLVDTCERPGPIVLTHKDVQPFNLLACDGRPVLLDWELSGMLDLSGELGSTALRLAQGTGFDSIQPDVFRAVLDGYVAGGGALPPPGPSWFVYMIAGWLGHTRWNIHRCLAGVEVSTGPDLALSQESVRDGLRGLPDMFGRLPQLEALLA